MTESPTTITEQTMKFFSGMPVTMLCLALTVFSAAKLYAQESTDSNAPPSEVEQPFGTPVAVVLKTELGDIEVEVYPDVAPKSAGSFLQYVDQGLYSDAAFYRTVRTDNDNGTPVIEVIQGGTMDFDNALEPVDHETTEQTGIRHTNGTLSLGRTDPGTGSGAAFFITVGDQPALDFGAKRNPDGQGFAAFGRVVSGMDVVRKIHQLEANGPADSDYVKGQILSPPVSITSVTRKQGS